MVHFSGGIPAEAHVLPLPCNNCDHVIQVPLVNMTPGNVITCPACGTSGTLDGPDLSDLGREIADFDRTFGGSPYPG